MEDNHKKTLSYVHVTAYPEETLTAQARLVREYCKRHNLRTVDDPSEVDPIDRTGG